MQYIDRVHLVDLDPKKRGHSPIQDNGRRLQYHAQPPINVRCADVQNNEGDACSLEPIGLYKQLISGNEDSWPLTDLVLMAYSEAKPSILQSQKTLLIYQTTISTFQYYQAQSLDLNGIILNINNLSV